MLGAGHTDSTPLRSKRPGGIVEQEDGASGIDFSQYKQSSNFKNQRKPAHKLASPNKRG